MKVGGWLGLCGVALILPNLVLPNLAAADAIPGSSTQIGAWRVTAYVRNQTGMFEHCALYRVHNEGFGLALGYTVRGIWTMAAEAPAWNLVAKESYTATLQVGSQSYTAMGRGLDARGMSFNVASEIFDQLKSGDQLEKERSRWLGYGCDESAPVRPAGYVHYAQVGWGGALGCAP